MRRSIRNNFATQLSSWCVESARLISCRKSVGRCPTYFHRTALSSLQPIPRHYLFETSKNITSPTTNSPRLRMAKRFIPSGYGLSSLSHFTMFETTPCAYGALSNQHLPRALHLSSANDVELSAKVSHFGNYKDAIHALNGLQSNSQTIQLAATRQLNNIDDTLIYLRRSGIEPEQLDRLSVIHVSGTKGKGSTCALTESILRSFGIKTGFFSSPHLVSVTERIRINGQPISEEMFTNYFWKVYNLLNCHKEYENDMPAYFKFLTILSFHVFLGEKVDVAIYEVGIGGERDCTNVLRTTKTVGITSLGLEHTTLLGNTLSEIARQKAGIIKPNSDVFTVNQPDECWDAIKQVVNERNAKLHIVPDFNDYKFPHNPDLQIKSKVQHLNASLAIQLAYNWLKKNHKNRLNGLVPKHRESQMIIDGSKEVVEGLEKCIWPGRCQVLELGNKMIHLDGAHTKESLEVCVDWFLNVTKNSSKPKCLLFNATGDRNSEKLMRVLASQIQFTAALFVPNVAFISENEDDTSDVLCAKSDEQTQRAHYHARLWPKLQNTPIIASFSSILDGILFLDEQYKDREIDVLITGSLNLVGSSLVALGRYTSASDRGLVTKS